MVLRISAVLISVLLLVPLVMPLAADAQGVPNVGNPGGSCPNLTVSLQRGSRDASTGGQVSQLQRFLAARYNVAQSEIVTGYFGPVTESYVIQFQTEQDISPIGIVGPQTRAAIARVCSGQGGGSASGGATSVTLSASPVSGTAPLIVAFVVTASGNSCDPFLLDFGDGYVESLPAACGTRTVPHTYATQGEYNAHLDSIRSGRVQRAQTTISVGAQVFAAPTCTMALSKSSIAANESVTLTWSSTNATSAKWGDGATTGTSGSALVNGLASTTAKSITFTGPGGSKTCTATITVTAPMTGTVVMGGNATANGSTVTLQGTQSNYKLAEFTLAAGSYENVTLNRATFTLRNQASGASSAAATVSNYRMTAGINSYPATIVKDGVNEKGTIALGSGLIIGAGQTVTVSILADVKPLAAGNLDLWIYPDDLGFIGATTNLAVKATSNVTNRVDEALLYWSGWISTRTGGNTDLLGSDCIMNGQGYKLGTVYTLENQSMPGPLTNETGRPMTCIADATGQNQCTAGPAGSLTCTANGWSGVNAYWYYGGMTKVACMSSNGKFVPGGANAYASASCENNACQYGNTNIDYFCDYKGWHKGMGPYLLFGDLADPPVIDGFSGQYQY